MRCLRLGLSEVFEWDRPDLTGDLTGRFDWAYLEQTRGDVVAFERFELGDTPFDQRRQRL